MTVLIYREPASISEAAALLAEYGSRAKVLAGGTALVLLLRQKMIRPGALVSLEHVDGLRGISLDAGGTLHVGAMTTLKQVAADPQVRHGWPLLAAACGAAGNVRLRNQATLGGNMAEADYASDPPSALVALDASVRVVGVRGERRIRLADFFRGFYTTALEEDEILAELLVPPLPAGTAAQYIKFKSRSAIDRPCVGVAALLGASGGVCTFARVAIGAACEVPQRFAELEAQLSGHPLRQDRIVEFAGAYAAALDAPLDDLRGSSSYRRAMTRVHVKRALCSLAGLGDPA